MALIGEGTEVEAGITRRVLADQIKERLLQGILDGRYPPDSRLVELQIARELGTSQAPVREALRGLEALGVVEISPFRGARVRRPSTTEILEAYVVRSELEALGVRLAIPRMTDRDLADLGRYVDEMRAAAAVDDPHRVAMADASFHSRVIEIAGNGALERVWRTLEPFSRTLITLVMPGADPEWTAGLHEPILAALQARDAQLAAGAIRRHFSDAEKKAAQVWDESDTSAGDRPAARAARTALDIPI
jgi:DNA-binding GntR family transcriptional regulator